MSERARCLSQVGYNPSSQVLAPPLVFFFRCGRSNKHQFYVKMGKIRKVGTTATQDELILHSPARVCCVNAVSRLETDTFKVYSDSWRKTENYFSGFQQ